MIGLLGVIPAVCHAGEIPSLKEIAQVYQARNAAIQTLHADYHIKVVPLLDPAAYYRAKRTYEVMPSDLTCVIASDGRRYESLSSSQHQLGDIARAIAKRN